MSTSGFQRSVRSRARSNPILKSATTKVARAVFGSIFARDLLEECERDIGVRRTYSLYAQAVWRQRILGFHRSAPCPIALDTTVTNLRKIHFADRTVTILSSPGCYFQTAAPISIGRGVWVGPRVTLITANHDLLDPTQHSLPLPIEVGDGCWIGANAVVMPGVKLGNGTVVGANSVVTRSFPDGNCVIAGAPARVIKTLQESSAPQ